MTCSSGKCSCLLQGSPNTQPATISPFLGQNEMPWNGGPRPLGDIAARQVGIGQRLRFQESSERQRQREGETETGRQTHKHTHRVSAVEGPHRYSHLGPRLVCDLRQGALVSTPATWQGRPQSFFRTESPWLPARPPSPLLCLLLCCQAYSWWPGLARRRRSAVCGAGTHRQGREEVKSSLSSRKGRSGTGGTQQSSENC